MVPRAHTPLLAQAGYVGLRALLIVTDAEQSGQGQGLEQGGQELGRMHSALWLMEAVAHGREWHAPQDITAAGQHLEAFDTTSVSASVPWRERVMSMLLCLHRVGIAGHLAAEIVGDVFHAEILSVLEGVAFLV